MEIHLIRHGKTEANEKRLYCGQIDLPLSQNGAQEIALFKSRGIYPSSADLFFSSGLLRSEQTIDIIYGKVSRIALPDIAEYHFGEYEMYSHDELNARDDYRLWAADKTGAVPCPGGESRKQFEKRVLQGYRCILNEAVLAGSDSVFVSCHGGSIVYIMEYLQPGIKKFYEWQPAPGRGYTLVFGDGQLREFRNL